VVFATGFSSTRSPDARRDTNRTDVVPVPFVLLARIAEACDELDSWTECKKGAVNPAPFSPKGGKAERQGRQK